MKNYTLPAIAATMLLTGCLVTSVHPFYTSKDVTYEPALLGNWTNAQGAEESWIFKNAGENLYRVEYTADGKTNLLRGTLFKIGQGSFIDLTSWDRVCDVVPPPVASHFLLRVIQSPPKLRLAALNHDWLQSTLASNPGLLQHLMVSEKDEKRVVLTAETTDIQKFLENHLSTEVAWKDAFDLKRSAPF
jgi:hypothetical protein